MLRFRAPRIRPRQRLWESREAPADASDAGGPSAWGAVKAIPTLAMRRLPNAGLAPMLQTCRARGGWGSPFASLDHLLLGLAWLCSAPSHQTAPTSLRASPRPIPALLMGPFPRAHDAFCTKLLRWRAQLENLGNVTPPCDIRIPGAEIRSPQQIHVVGRQ
jgi:hypothetical protein